MLEANNLCAIIEILAFYAFLLLGLQKCHIKHNLQQMSKKEKYVSALLITIMLLLAAISVSGVKQIEAENSHPVFQNLFQMLNDVFQKNVTVLLLMKYALLIIPGVLLLSLGLKIFSEAICLATLQIYYFLVICVADMSLYRSLEWSFVEAISFLVLTTFFYCSMICFKERFTKKKVVFLVLLAVLFMGTACISGQAIYGILTFFARQVLIGILLSLILKYVRYLRVTLRKVITLLIMIGIVALQILY